ncbi:hypothetical protein D918_02394 [Trichuris suis]|nr:hypothetical protein D918_02394 [Trichuris suis]
MELCFREDCYSLHPGTPWIPRGKDYLDGLIGLHEELEDFCRWILPTPVEHYVRNIVFFQVKEAILKLWPDAIVSHVYAFMY